MTSAFSWQNSISLCPASFRIPRPNLPVTPGVSWLPTFAFQSPIMKRVRLGVRKDWRQEEKGMTEDKMVGWHHWLNGPQAPGDGEVQGNLVCCNPWGHKELDTSEWLNNNRQESAFAGVQVGSNHPLLLCEYVLHYKTVLCVQKIIQIFVLQELFSFLFFKFYFIFKLYIIVLVLPNIEMNLPQVYLCSPSWTLFPPPSPYPPSGLSQRVIFWFAC